jgi:hypothetical protein
MSSPSGRAPKRASLSISGASVARANIGSGVQLRVKAPSSVFQRA